MAVPNTIITARMLQVFLETLSFNASFVTEEIKSECLMILLEDMKEYAQDFYREFDFWSSAPNRKRHIPYVLKIVSTILAKNQEQTASNTLGIFQQQNLAVLEYQR